MSLINPIPECGDEIESVVKVLRLNKYVRVNEELSRRQGVG